MKCVVVAILVLCFSALICLFLQQDCDLVLRFYLSFGPEPCSVLHGKVVWITGASSGIGRQLAYDLAGCGCKLVLSARKKQKLEDVKQKCADIALERRGIFDKDDIMVLPLDVTSFTTHVDLANQVVRKYGWVDVLVNNAGVSQMQTFSEEMPLAVENNVLNINLVGTISLTKAVLPHMLKRQKGQIVAVNSLFGKFVSQGFSAYCASKFGIKAYFDALRKEVSSRNIRVVNVHPGPVESDILQNALSTTVNVTAKDSPMFQQFLDKFHDVEFMATERFTYLTRIAMANDIQESWMAPPGLMSVFYLAHFTPFL